MTKKTVNICDRCNTIVAIKKCEICDKDICAVCEEDLGASLHQAGGGGPVNEILHIVCCKNCAYGLTQTKLKTFFDDDAHKDIRRKMILIFKNALLVNSLQDKKVKKAIDNSWTAGKAYRTVTGFGGRKRTIAIPTTPTTSSLGTRTGSWAQAMKGGTK